MTFLDPIVEAVEGEAVAPDIAGLGEDIAAQIADRGEAYIAVDSSAIEALLYREDHTLSIVFKDGSRYVIDNFPAIELGRWLDSGSIGSYFNRNVRGKY